MRVKLRPAALLVALAGAGLGVSACAEEENPEVPEVRQAVTEFSTAADQQACDLLTEEALERIYGGKAKCVRSSGDFQSGAVRLEMVDVMGERARVTARSLGGDKQFTLALKKVLPKGCASRTGNWLIDQVRVAPAR